MTDKTDTATMKYRGHDIPIQDIKEECFTWFILCVDMTTLFQAKRKILDRLVAKKEGQENVELRPQGTEAEND